jgi:hypothetical protein
MSGPHFLRRLLYRQRGEIAVRAALDLAAQRFQRRKPAADRVPQHQAGEHDQDELRQDHASDDLPREFVARRAVLATCTSTMPSVLPVSTGSRSVTMRTGRPRYVSS